MSCSAEQTRQLHWAAFGFTLPAGLAEAPADLVGTQDDMLVELTAASENDWNFELPVQLLWGRMLPRFREADTAQVVERALRRLYNGRSDVAVQLQPLRDYKLVRRGQQVEVASPSLREAQVRSHIGAAVVAARAVSERCLDLADQVARVYLGRGVQARSHVLSAARSRQLIQQLTDEQTARDGARRVGAQESIAIGAITAAAKHLSDDQFPVLSKVYGGPTSEPEAETLRHMWAHGLDQDFELVSQQSLYSLCDLVSQHVGFVMWLLTGTSSGSSCSEWFDARTDRQSREESAAST